MMHYDYQSRMEVQATPWSLLTLQYGWPHYQLAGVEVPTPYLTFLETTLEEMLGYFIISWGGWNSRLTTQPLLVWVWVRPVYLKYLAGAEWLFPKFSVLLGLPFSWSFGEREKAFLGSLFHLWLGVSRLLSSPSKLGHMREKENLRNSLSTVPWVPRSLAFQTSSFHLLSSYVCFIYHVQCFSCTWLMEQGKVHLLHFLKNRNLSGGFCYLLLKTFEFIAVGNKHPMYVAMVNFMYQLGSDSPLINILSHLLYRFPFLKYFS